MRLKNRIENLEEKLTIKIENLEKQLEKTQDTLKFALEYGKDHIKVWSDYIIRGYFTINNYIFARYIRNGEVCEAKKEIPYSIVKSSLSVEKNPDGTYFIKGKSIKDKEEKDVYFQLIKDTDEIIDITQIKETFENQEKITEHLENSAKSLADAFSAFFNNINTSKTEKSDNISKEKNKENIGTEKRKIDKNPIKYKEPTSSALMTYYHKYGLDLGIKNFSPIRRLSEKEAATLLYLFDQYKYVNEIVKHINLSRNSIITYAYTLRKVGYLIYEREMGRVANGCLIYNK